MYSQLQEVVFPACSHRLTNAGWIKFKSCFLLLGLLFLVNTIWPLAYMWATPHLYFLFKIIFSFWFINTYSFNDYLVPVHFTCLTNTHHPYYLSDSILNAFKQRSLNLHNSPMRWVLPLSLFNRWGSWGSENLSDLPDITHRVEPVFPRVCACSHHIMLSPFTQQASWAHVLLGTVLEAEITRVDPVALGECLGQFRLL